MSPVAIAHDYFTQRGGAERVAERLAALYPDALVLTSVISAGARPASLAGHRVRPTALQRLADARVPLGALAPLLPVAFGRAALPAGTRVVLSSSSAFALHVRVPAGAVHIAYCHTPPRFLWERDEYFRERPLAQRALGPALAVARRADLAAARRVDVFLANSAFTAARIRRCYGRDARVVYPPVEVDAFGPPIDERSDRFLVVGRLKRHKRFDLAIEAANRARLPLDVIGDGPEAARLRRIAGPTIRFHGRLSDAQLRAAMARAAGLLVPGVEDFGMTTAEVQAAGCPPIAFARGGSLEIVRDGETGFLFHEQTPGALAAAMRRALAEPIPAAALVASARRFDAAHFDAAIRAAVAEALA